MRTSIGGDSLGYISLEGLIAATEQPADNLCRACFDGVYPVALPPPDVREHQTAGPDLLVLGHDALSRP